MLVGASGNALALKAAIPLLLGRFVSFGFALPGTKLLVDAPQSGLTFQPELIVEG